MTDQNQFPFGYFEALEQFVTQHAMTVRIDGEEVTSEGVLSFAQSQLEIQAHVPDGHMALSEALIIRNQDDWNLLLSFLEDPRVEVEQFGVRVTKFESAVIELLILLEYHTVAATFQGYMPGYQPFSPLPEGV